jgi:hypothetical protein
VAAAVVIIGAHSQDALLEHWVQLTARFNTPARPLTALIVDGVLAPPLAALVPSAALIESVSVGCLCCQGGPVLKTVLARVLRQLKMRNQPCAVWILGSPQSKLARLADAIDSPLLSQQYNLTALVWVPGSSQQAPADQIEAASESLLGNETPKLQFQWPRHQVFSRLRLKTQLDITPGVNEVFLDIKTERAWYRIESFEGRWHWRESQWRLCSRLVSKAAVQNELVVQIRKTIDASQMVSGT